MADERNRGRGDEVEQDGMGRDAAHGGERPTTSGGSYGRDTGRAGDDLLGIGDDATDPSSGGRGASIPRGTDEHAEDRSARQGDRGGGDAAELDLRPDVGRRDPTR
jgi:hypothetical protein